jgi:hypothetical protein
MRLNIFALLLLSGGVALTLAHGAVPEYGWHALRGAIYLIHGGSLADRQPVTPQDHKLSILIDGTPAKEIFNSIGPDLPATCSGEKGDRARNKQGVTCSYKAMDKGTKEGPYRCWIGIDLRTGNTTATSSC